MNADVAKTGTGRRYLFTSESVTEGHPDKMCDQIADAVLDAILEQDPLARVACEVATTTGLILLMGEMTTTARIDLAHIARETVRQIGYDRAEYGFDCETCSVLTAVHGQSSDIAHGVDRSFESRTGGPAGGAADPFEALGAGDQGLMFGYATDETPELMPLPIALAHRLTGRLAAVRKAGILSYLRPDGKAQVTVEYHNDRPARVDTVVVSTQHGPEVSAEALQAGVLAEVIRPALPAHLLDDRTRIFVNPSGRFVIGGPHGDSGLTGRKIIVDTYGGAARHGGGALSGKDATKVDRSAAYAARHVAKNIVAAGLARRCEVQIAYAIGVARPVSLYVNTFGTGALDDAALAELLQHHFDLRPGAIIERLQLRRPIYRQTAAYGHFGRADLDLPWERTDVAETLRLEADRVQGVSAQPAAARR